MHEREIILNMTCKLLEKNTLEDCLSDASILNNGLFVLNQGDQVQIQSCAKTGARILLPNLGMSHSLIYRTIIREARNKVVLSACIWEKMRDTFESSSFSQWAPELVIYKQCN